MLKKNTGRKKRKNTKRRLRLCRCKEVLEEVMSVMPFKYMVGLIAWNWIYISIVFSLNLVTTILYTIVKDGYK